MTHDIRRVVKMEKGIEGYLGPQNTY